MANLWSHQCYFKLLGSWSARTQNRHLNQVVGSITQTASLHHKQDVLEDQSRLWFILHADVLKSCLLALPECSKASKKVLSPTRIFNLSSNTFSSWTDPFSSMSRKNWTMVLLPNNDMPACFSWPTSSKKASSSSAFLPAIAAVTAGNAPTFILALHA